MNKVKIKEFKEDFFLVPQISSIAAEQNCFLQTNYSTYVHYKLYKHKKDFFVAAQILTYSSDGLLDTFYRAVKKYSSVGILFSHLMIKNHSKSLEINFPHLKNSLEEDKKAKLKKILIPDEYVFLEIRAYLGEAIAQRVLVYKAEMIVREVF